MPRGSLNLEHSSMLTTGSMWMRVSRIWTYSGSIRRISGVGLRFGPTTINPTFAR